MPEIRQLAGRDSEKLPPQLAQLTKAGPHLPLPEKYRVTITVEPMDESGAELTVKLEDVARADILHPDYRNDGIAALVRNLDLFVYGVPKP